MGSTAGTGEECLALLEKRGFDLIVLDLGLPGLSGLDVLDRLQAADCAADVVVLTAMGTVETAVEAVKRGAEDFLTKPADFGVLEALYHLGPLSLGELAGKLLVTGGNSAGDFSPVTPVKKYQDEFTNLAIAINRMSREIQERENQLVETRKMAAIGTLTAGIAHEINNPLNNISLTSEALLSEFDTYTDVEKLDMLKDILYQKEKCSGLKAEYQRKFMTSLINNK